MTKNTDSMLALVEELNSLRRRVESLEKSKRLLEQSYSDLRKDFKWLHERQIDVAALRKEIASHISLAHQGEDKSTSHILDAVKEEERKDELKRVLEDRKEALKKQHVEEEG